MKADQIFKLRQRLFWSQNQMAEYVGVDRSTVSRWERGRSVIGPGLKMLERLAEDERLGRRLPIANRVRAPNKSRKVRRREASEHAVVG